MFLINHNREIRCSATSHSQAPVVIQNPRPSHSVTPVTSVILNRPQSRPVTLTHNQVVTQKLQCQNAQQNSAVEVSRRTTRIRGSSCLVAMEVDLPPQVVCQPAGVRVYTHAEPPDKAMGKKRGKECGDGVEDPVQCESNQQTTYTQTHRPVTKHFVDWCFPPKKN